MPRKNGEVYEMIGYVKGQANTERERKLRSLQIAEEYLKMNNYTAAEEYIEEYLSVRTDSAAAHKVLGKCFEVKGDIEKAAAEYKLSLVLNENQPELVIKVCDLLQRHPVEDNNLVEYWIAMGNRFFPEHAVVSALKEEFCRDTVGLHDFLTQELRKKPHDVDLRVKLMLLNLSSNKVEEAYMDVRKELAARNPFYYSSKWYGCCAKVCEAYLKLAPEKRDANFYIVYLYAWDRFYAAKLLEMKPPSKEGISECMEMLEKYDDILRDANASMPINKTFGRFLQQMSQELCFFVASLLMVQKEFRVIPNVNQYMSILFLQSSARFGIPKVKDEVVNAIILEVETLMDYRTTQCGYVLRRQLFPGDDTEAIMREIYSYGRENWKELALRALFRGEYYDKFVRNSYFVADNFQPLPDEFPAYTDVADQLSTMYRIYPVSLHHLVWLGWQVLRPQVELSDQNWSLAPEFAFSEHHFDGMPYSSYGLKLAEPETLSILDMETFLFSCVFSVESHLDKDCKWMSTYGSPAEVTPKLCTPKQASWWLTAYLWNSRLVDAHSATARAIIQEGLSAIRMAESFSLDVRVIMGIARTFAKRGEVEPNVDRKEALKERAVYYYENAQKYLVKLGQSGTPIRYDPKSYFQFNSHQLPEPAVQDFLFEIRSYLMRSGFDHEIISYSAEFSTPRRSGRLSLENPRSPAENLYTKILAKCEVMFNRQTIQTTKIDSVIRTLERLESKLDAIDAKVEVAQSEIGEVKDLMDRYDDEEEEDSRGRSDFQNVSQDTPARYANAAPQPALYRNLFPGADVTPVVPSYGPANFPPGYVPANVPPGYLPANAPPGYVPAFETPYYTGPITNAAAYPTDWTKPSPANICITTSPALPAQSISISQTPLSVTIPAHLLKSSPSSVTQPATGRVASTTGQMASAVNGPFVFGGQTSAQILGTGKPTNTVSAAEVSTSPSAGFNSSFRKIAFVTSALSDTVSVTTQTTAASVSSSVSSTPSSKAISKTGSPSFTSRIANVIEGAFTPISTSAVSPKTITPIASKLFANIPTAPSSTIASTPVKPTSTIANIPTTPTSTIAKTPSWNVAITDKIWEFPKPMGTISATTPEGGMEKPATEAVDLNNSKEDEEFVPSVHFEPVVPLPEIVQIVTGEEGMEVLYYDRCKLLRFVSKQWKDRGVGDMKILYNPKEGSVRLLMRRDRVHKVCCNQKLTPLHELKAMPNNDRAWTWYGQDFSEGELTTELFAIRFKTAEQAEKFRVAFYDAKNKVKMEPEDGERPLERESAETKKAVPLSELFKPQEGVWECDACYTRNTGEICACCSTPRVVKRGEVKDKDPSEDKKVICQPGKPFDNDLTTKFSNIAADYPSFANTTEKGEKERHFNFGKFSSTGSDFSAISQISSSSVFSSQTKSDIQKDKNDGPFNFSEFASTGLDFSTKSSSLQTKSGNEKDKKDEPFGFAKFASTGLDFSTISQKSSSSQTKSGNEKDKKDEPFGFAKLASTGLDFSTISQTASPTAHSSPKQSNFKGFAGAGTPVFGFSVPEQNATDATLPEGAEQPEEFVPSVVFEPVIPLPDTVEVITGEEGLELLFKQRCKLLRFVNNEWKERGVGDMKIYLDRTNGTVRLLMRRDLVYKLCCNQTITASHQLLPMKLSDKAFTWYGQDYSEGELKNELFAIRFKNTELANEFKAEFDKAKLKLTDLPKKGSSSTTEETAQPATSGFSEFKIAPDSWVCDSCCVRNDADKKLCPCCSNPKPGETANSPQPKSYLFGNIDLGIKPGAGLPTFSFGMPKTESNETNVTGIMKSWSFNANVKSTGTSSISSPPEESYGTDSADKSKTSPMGIPNYFGIKSDPSSTDHSFLTANGTLETELDDANDHIDCDTLENYVLSDDEYEVTSFSMDDQVLFTSQAFVEINDGVNDAIREWGLVSVIFSEGRVRVIAQKDDDQEMILSYYVDDSLVFDPYPPEKSQVWEILDDEYGSVVRKQIIVTFITQELSNDFRDFMFFGRDDLTAVNTSTEPEQSHDDISGDNASSDKTSHSALEHSSPLLQYKSEGEDSPNVWPVASTSTDHSRPTFSGNTGPFKYNAGNFLGGTSTMNAMRVVDIGTSVEEGSTDEGKSTQSSDSYREEANRRNILLKEPEFKVPNDVVSKPSISKDDTPAISLSENKKVEAVGFGWSPASFGTLPFGLKGSSIFTGYPEPKANVSASTSFESAAATPSFLLKDTGLSFAALAQSVTTDKDVKPDFKWPGIGSNVFRQPEDLSKSVNAEDGPDRTLDNSAGEGAGEDAEPDPHFEPIIPLPDIVQVTTGEEDESVVFAERAKVFRFEPRLKEWKERGVGTLKILHNKSTDVYRLLLRRDQVYKVVLNMRLAPDWTSSPLSTRKDSVCFAGFNMSDEVYEPTVEKLAVRFKTENLLQNFLTQVNKCLEKMLPNEAGKETEGSEENPNDEDREKNLQLLAEELHKTQLSDSYVFVTNTDGTYDSVGGGEEMCYPEVSLLDASYSAGSSGSDGTARGGTHAVTYTGSESERSYNSPGSERDLSRTSCSSASNGTLQEDKKVVFSVANVRLIRSWYENEIYSNSSEDEITLQLTTHLDQSFTIDARHEQSGNIELLMRLQVDFHMDCEGNICIWNEMLPDNGKLVVKAVFEDIETAEKFHNKVMSSVAALPK